jgi:alkylation response protein AidB-like acyl-CoA dehydrogenase
MSDDLSELHAELRSVARDLLARSGSGTGTAHSTAPAQADWELMARSGWTGLEVPEVLEGSAATFAEVGVILEEMGRAASVSPYLGAVVLGVGALGLVEASPLGDDLLRRIATGELVVAVALTDGALDHVDAVPPFRVEASPEGLMLHGRADFVPDAADASDLLLVALGPGGGPVLVHLPATAAGLEVLDQPVLDETRRLGAVSAAGVVLGDGAVLSFSGDAELAVARLSDRAALAVAHDCLGVARAMLDATVAYVTQRRQFDRAVGSFQAVKHACADMLVNVTVVEELVRAANEAFCADDPGAGVAVSMAKARSCEVAVDVAGTAMQLHGGIGYTWEGGIHVHLKRAALNRSFFGSPTAHRRRVAAPHVVGSVTGPG